MGVSGEINCKFLNLFVNLFFFMRITKSFKLDNSKERNMPKLDRRTIVLWVITAAVIGSFYASLNDAIRHNFLFVIYGALVGAWIFVLTGIASVHIKKETKQNPS